MGVITAVSAVAAALVLAVSTPAILGALPSPAGEPDPPDYRGLATPGFRVGVGLTATVALLLAVRFAPVPSWPAWFALGTAGVLQCWVDAASQFLPLLLARVILAGGLVGLGWTAVVDPLAAGIALICGIAAGCGFRLLWQLSGGLGYGDVRLAGGIGLVTGLVSWQLTVSALLAGTVLGAVVAVVAARIRGADGPVAYGPSLLAGSYLALVATSF